MKSLDLHGVKHDEVVNEVVRFIESDWCSIEDKEIVTGHSNMMQEIVSKVLMEYNFYFVKYPTSIIIKSDF